MKRRSVQSFLSAAAVVLTVALVAQAKLQSIGTSEVAFMAVGPGGLKINGSVSGLKAKEDGGKLTMTVNLNTIKTGIGLRDKHTKKAIKAAKHPHATLVVSRSSLKFPADQKVAQSSATGQMTINGVTKPVTFKYKVKRTGIDYHVKGTTQIKYTDFGIEEQCYLGVCVKPEVKIRVGFKLRDK